MITTPWRTCTGQYTVQYSTIQYNTVQYNTVQYSTVQYSTVQYSTVQYSTAQYRVSDDTQAFIAGSLGVVNKPNCKADNAKLISYIRGLDIYIILI